VKESRTAAYLERRLRGEWVFYILSGSATIWLLVEFMLSAVEASHTFTFCNSIEQLCAVAVGGDANGSKSSFVALTL
jgi:uncharacterized membrane protein